ncbi:hypothetical protein SNEBB_010758 [Seison nebaliae]|nr:hypothetical protein SNEBB_010758 [Seison nebaliae]
MEGRIFGRCIHSFDNRNRFEVVIPYNSPYLLAVRSMTSRIFDKDLKRWTFSISEYERFLQIINSLKSQNIFIEPLSSNPNQSSVPSTAGNRKRTCNDKMNISIKFLMRDNDRVSILMPFNREMIDLIKSRLKTRKYDADKRQWHIHIDEYEQSVELFEKVNSSNLQIDLMKLPDDLVNFQKDLISTSQTINDDNDDDLMKRIPIFEKLMPFQKETVRKAIKLHGKILIADDMGLGKTIQSLAISLYYREKWPLLIICPSSVRYSWFDAIKVWCSSILTDMSITDKTSNSGTSTVTSYSNRTRISRKLDSDLIDNWNEIVQIITTGKDVRNRIGVDNSRIKIYLISYDMMVNVKDDLIRMIGTSPKIIIADESHYMKSLKSNRTKTITSYLKKCDHIILLSGTPALSRPAELFPQIHVLCPKLFSSFHDFGVRYCGAVQTKWGWNYSKSSNLDELQNLLNQHCLIRHTKSEVLQQLPEKIRERVIMDSSLIDFSSETLQRSKNQFEKKKSDNKKLETEKRTEFLEFYRETAVAKIDALKKFFKETLETEGENIIIFAHHQLILDELEEFIKDKNFPYMRIDGKTSSKKRYDNVEWFQKPSDNMKIALLSITAANSGISLTSATVVYFAEMFWNPGVLLQAEDRVYRIGQKNSVFIRYLIAEKTADESLWRLLEYKLYTLKSVGLSNVSFANTKSKVELSDQTTIDEFFELKENLENDEIPREILNELE